MDKYTVRDSSGAVDIQASAASYAEALTKWCEGHEMSSDRIASAVNAVFDRFPEKLPMPALLSLAVAELSADPTQHKALTERVHAYVRGQNGITLDIGRGKGGGVSRK